MSEESLGLALQLATLIAVIAAVWQLFLQSKQMHRELEMVYIQRYWDIMDKRSNKFVAGGRPSKFDELLILQYMQLSEDEIDLRAAGRVTDNTWKIWEDSIRAQISQPSFARALQNTSSDSFPSLRQLLRSPPLFDPLRRSRAGRFIRGL